MLRPLLAALALTTLLVGCETPLREAAAPLDRVALQASASTSGLRAQVSGQTLRSVHVIHGAQFKYLAPGGVAWFWNPTQKVAVQGRWSVMDTAKGPALCLVYSPSPAPARNDWDCTPGPDFLAGVTASAPGDIFHLAGGSIPFVLPHRNLLTLEEAAARAGQPG